MKNKRTRKIGALIMLVIITLSLICMVYADGGATTTTTNKYAKNASDWIMSGIQLVVLVVVAGFSIKHLVKRQFAQFAGFAILASFILVIVYDAKKLKTIGEYIWNIIFN